MSNEITINMQIRVQNPTGSTSGYTQNIQANRMYNQNSIGANSEIVSVPVVAQNYTFSNIATPGFFYLQNLDSANFVQYGRIISTVFYPLGMIEAGEVHLFRLAPGASLAMVANLQAPAQPTVTQQTTGGTVAAGTYKVEVSYVNASGESVASAQQTVTTTTGTSTITIDSPPATGGGAGEATGWYAYVSQDGGSTLTRQQAAGSPTAIGTNLTLTAPPTNTGTNPLSTATVTPVNVNYLLLED